MVFSDKKIDIYLAKEIVLKTGIEVPLLGPL